MGNFLKLYKSKIRYISFCFIILCLSCKNAKSEVTLNLQNHNIKYINKDFVDVNLNYNNKEQERSETVLTFTLNNPGNKKLLFAFDTDKIMSYGIIKQKLKSELSFLIKNREGAVLKISQAIIDHHQDNICDCDFKNYNLEKLKYRKLGVKDQDFGDYKNFVENSFNQS